MEHILVESERLLIRRPEEKDERSLERVLCDPAMMRYLGEIWTPQQVVEAAREWREEWGVNHRWSGVLLRKDTGEPIGAETHPDNPASNRVLEKLGFECLGERQHHYDYLPGFDTQLLWTLTRWTWQQGACAGVRRPIWR
jgi:RimJ/RimL family protein N-acetyltransferase